MRKNIFSWKSLAGFALLFGLTMGLSSCEQVEVGPNPSDPGTNEPQVPSEPSHGGTKTVAQLTITKPSEFKTQYELWHRAQLDAIGKETDPVKRQAALDEFNTATLDIELNTAGLVTSATDKTIDLGIITENRNIINVIFGNAFKNADAGLVITDKSAGNVGIFDITLPATSKAFDLEVNITESVALVHSAKDATTALGFLKAKGSDEEYVGDGDHDDEVNDEHGVNVKGMILGEGLVADAYHDYGGSITVDGTEIGAYGLDSQTSMSFSAGHSCTYTKDAATGKKLVLRVVKVFKGATGSTLTFDESKSAAAMDKMIVCSDTKVNVKGANVTEIVGEDKAKSKIEFMSDCKVYVNLESVNKVTITNTNLSINGKGVPAEPLNDCIIEASKVLVYPEAGLANVTFKEPNKNHTTISVIPPVQSSAIPDYTYTFTKCEFQAATSVTVSDNGGQFNGGTPILDENGDWAYRIKYHYAEYVKNETTNKWEWQWTSSYDKNDIPAEALKMNYWFEVYEYFYSADNTVNLKKIKDYDVIIAMDGCKAGGSPVNNMSNIYGIYNESGEYDINDKYAIDGTVYVPERVYYSETEDDQRHESYIYLVKE